MAQQETQNLRASNIEHLLPPAVSESSLVAAVTLDLTEVADEMSPDLSWLSGIASGLPS